MKIWSVCVGAVFLFFMGLVSGFADEAHAPQAGTQIVPHYTAAGELIRPTDYHLWVFVGASLGMSYEEPGKEKADGPGIFGNVYLEPTAYRQYVETGKFPEKTMLALAVHKPASDVSINKRGHFEGEQIALEIALKDHEQFKEGWAYFDFPMGKDTAKAFPKETCHSCHVQHAADDNVFVQFYPILRGLHGKKAEAQNQHGQQDEQDQSDQPAQPAKTVEQ
jgi:hypothetical protein